ncbi:hypothetical protein [Vibrio jasicida]|uniref:Zinc finger/thioredoxin putative domain-containing protein n=1 Tax=Vibrio jasicida TaxID=766224 RepID=A0AAU9QG77_9VIBR|nr:hypothetical protein [Vibrio jasicida]CAH1564773.1 conserved hypothetical protein [Vibrio jasicida]CAH1573874.1 conserved hypothetical protein [Vibrio jasicida]
MKHPNPVRGYIQCPQCPEVATVHQVGEGELIATGNTPKNSRNIGLKYYKCPKCGNSSISKSCDEFINQNMHTEQPEPTLEPFKSNNKDELFNALESVKQDNPTTVIDVKAQASNDEALSGDIVTEQSVKPALKTQSNQTLKRISIALALLAFALWSVSKLLPPQQEEKTSV